MFKPCQIQRQIRTWTSMRRVRVDSRQIPPATLPCSICSVVAPAAISRTCRCTTSLLEPWQSGLNTGFLYHCPTHAGAFTSLAIGPRYTRQVLVHEADPLPGYTFSVSPSSVIAGSTTTPPVAQSRTGCTFCDTFRNLLSSTTGDRQPTRWPKWSFFL